MIAVEKMMRKDGANQLSADFNSPICHVAKPCGKLNVQEEPGYLTRPRLRCFQTVDSHHLAVGGGMAEYASNEL